MVSEGSPTAFPELLMDVDVARADGSAGQASLLPGLVVLFLALAAVGAWFLIGPAVGGGRYFKVGYNRTAYEYTRMLLPTFIPYAAVLWAWRRGYRAPLWMLLTGAAVLHVLVLFAPLPQSQDFYQYLFYGKMQVVHGANPFVVNPSVFWADRWFPWIRWNTQPSVYGPAWILVSAGVVKAAGSSLASAFVGLKLVILALDAAIVALIVVASRPGEDRAGFGILAYAWNPLVLVSVPLAGSADTAVAAAFLGALVARRRGRVGVATLLLALASLVKIYAVLALVLHLTLVLQERGTRRAGAHAAGAFGIAALAYLPYWHGLSTFGGVLGAAGLTNQSLMGTFQRTVVAFVLHVAGVHYWYTGAIIGTRALGAALVLAALIWGIRTARDERSLWVAVLGVMLTYLLVTPWFLYWYLLAPVAVAAAIERNRFTDPILTFSGTSLISIYIPVAPVLWIVQTVLRYAPPFAVFLRQRSGERVGVGAGHRSFGERLEPVTAGLAGSPTVGRAPAAK